MSRVHLVNPHAISHQIIPYSRLVAASAGKESVTARCSTSNGSVTPCMVIDLARPLSIRSHRGALSALTKSILLKCGLPRFRPRRISLLFGQRNDPHQGRHSASNRHRLRSRPTCRGVPVAGPLCTLERPKGGRTSVLGGGWFVLRRHSEEQSLAESCPADRHSAHSPSPAQIRNIGVRLPTRSGSA